MEGNELGPSLGTPVVLGNLLICGSPSLRSEIIRIWPPCDWIPVSGIAVVTNVCASGNVDAASETCRLCYLSVDELRDGR